LSTDITLNVTRLDRNELRALSRDPQVELVAPAIPMKLISPLVAEFPHALEGATWSVTAVGADTSPFTGDGVTVAILDTGIDLSHPTFAGVNIVARDFTGDDDYTDANGHGTHFAGSVFGRPIDGLRIGVAPGVKKALIAKTIGSRGGSSSAFLSALLWAVEQGADIIALAAQFDLVGIERSYRELIGLSAEAGLARTLDDTRANALLFERAIALIGQSEIFGHPTIICRCREREPTRCWIRCRRKLAGQQSRDSFGSCGRSNFSRSYNLTLF
jgi:subtilisin family serine protease